MESESIFHIALLAGSVSAGCALYAGVLFSKYVHSIPSEGNVHRTSAVRIQGRALAITGAACGIVMVTIGLWLVSVQEKPSLMIPYHLSANGELVGEELEMSWVEVDVVMLNKVQANLNEIFKGQRVSMDTEVVAGLSNAIPRLKRLLLRSRWRHEWGDPDFFFRAIDSGVDTSSTFASHYDVPLWYYRKND